MTEVSDLRFLSYDAAGARDRRKQVQQVYEKSYIDAIAGGGQFESVSAFMERFDAYASNPDLDLLIAFDGQDAVGQTWGWPLPAHARWWSGLISKPDDDFTQEDGRRTFALSEIMVAKEYTGRGVAHALHDHLLRGRPECRATLLAEAENDRAYRAYLRWGWQKAAELNPGWPGAPTFDVLMLDLDARRAS